MPRKISFDCPVNVLERLDQLAAIAELPRQKLMLHLIDAGLTSIEDCQKAGVFQFSVLIQDMKNHMQQWASYMRKKQDLSGLE